MSAEMIRLSVPPFGPLASRSSSPAGLAAAPDLTATSAAPQPVKAPAPRVRPVWPDPATINLAGELLDLSSTTIAYTGTITLPDTGADFWAMLAVALGEGRRG
ncbi:conserved hypothetical protein [Hoeflea sp. EC-HK425]|nr:conserved hypothetical protein [Hoeflea sp. EC-HK425]